MFTASPLSGNKAEQYEQLIAQCQALLHGERHRVANAANLSALVYHALPGLNWVGFYFFDGTELVVGPFQGHPACVRIAIGRGVCGTAAATRQTQRIADVDAFPGHARAALVRAVLVVLVLSAVGVAAWMLGEGRLEHSVEPKRTTQRDQGKQPFAPLSP